MSSGDKGIVMANLDITRNNTTLVIFGLHCPGYITLLLLSIYTPCYSSILCSSCIQITSCISLSAQLASTSSLFCQFYISLSCGSFSNQWFHKFPCKYKCSYIVNNAIGMVLGNHVIYICSILLSFVAIKMHLFQYTFTG